MSAFIMSDEEFDTIVSYFVKPIQAIDGGAYLPFENGGYEYLSMRNAAEVARILQRQNVRSVNERYGEGTEELYAFNYDPTAHKRPIGNIIGALDCLEYQSCESDDYHQTNAYEIITGLRKHLLKTIAEKDDTYTWGIK